MNRSRLSFSLHLGLMVQILAFLCLGQMGLAHGSLHDQISAITARLESGAFTAEDLLKRARLHVEHGDYDKALQDCDAAEVKQPKSPGVHFARGEVLSNAGRLVEARAALSHYLGTITNSPSAYIARARVLLKLGEAVASAEDFQRAIDLAKAPEPDLFWECAHAYQAAGRNEQALEILHSATKRFGSTASLEDAAINIEVSMGRYDEALARLHLQCAKSPRPERWLKQKGEILERADRRAEALHAYEEALVAIRNLPLRHRNTPTVQELQTEIHRHLIALKRKTP